MYVGKAYEVEVHFKKTKTQFYQMKWFGKRQFKIANIPPARSRVGPRFNKFPNPVLVFGFNSELLVNMNPDEYLTHVDIEFYSKQGTSTLAVVASIISLVTLYLTFPQNFVVAETLPFVVLLIVAIVGVWGIQKIYRDSVIDAQEVMVQEFKSHLETLQLSKKPD